jgi:small GTP-binding protein
MIEGIFLIDWNENVDQSAEPSENTPSIERVVENSQIICYYPKNDVTLNNSSAIGKIIGVHKEEILSKLKHTKNKKTIKDYWAKNKEVLLKSQEIFDFIIYSYFILPTRIICLVFDKQENPLDYECAFENSLQIFVIKNANKFYKYKDDEIESVLVSIFMDIRSRCLILMDESSYYVSQQDLKLKVINNNNKIIKVFLYGIDNAGKSSFTRYLKTGRYDHNYFLPTKKFVIHKITLPKNKLKIVCWEMPGQKTFRRAWLRGVQSSNLLIFMLDAADEERYSEAKRALFSIISRYEIKGVPLLFIANKIDLIDNQQKLGSIESDFSLLDLKEDRKLTIKFMSLVTKQGINEVINWIADRVSEELIKENRV